MNDQAAKVESEIERQFYDRLRGEMREDLTIECQVPFNTGGGSFRGDFVVRCGNRVVLLECDGREFHQNFAKDRRRDALILDGTGVTDVLRIRGADIVFAGAEVVALMQTLFPWMFNESATPFPASPDEIPLIASLFVRDDILPIWRTRLPRAWASALEAEQGHLSTYFSVLGATSDHRSMIVQWKSPFWNWRYKGVRAWRVADYIRLFFEKWFKQPQG